MNAEIKTTIENFFGDGYEFSISEAMLKSKTANRIAVYDLFFRKINENGGFAIFAGLETISKTLKSLEFSDELLEILENQGVGQELLEYLKNFKFSCDLWAVPEGTPIFPNEPILKVRGPAIQCQLLENLLLYSINHESAVATKAARMVRAAAGIPLFEHSSRRAPSTEISKRTARSAYISGFAGTSNILAADEYNIPLHLTMTHSFVQMFENEYDAFCAFAKANPDKCNLIIDTYDTLNSGIINAIRVFDNILKPLGQRPKSVRIDSGDLAYLSKKIRKTLNLAGYPDCDIIVSNSLDERIISEMTAQQSKADGYIIGEKVLGTEFFGAIYKLSAIEQHNVLVPKINLSENIHKITIPADKKVFRLYSTENGKAIADVLTLSNENIDASKPYTLFDPDFTWKKRDTENFITRELLTKIYENGQLKYTFPTLEQIRKYASTQALTLWDEVKRFDNPHKYYVDMSVKLWKIRTELIEKYKN